MSQYGIPERNACDDIWFQYDWQNAGKFSREELARVLHEAETVTATHLGFYPIPVWIEEEEHEIMSALRQERYNYRNAVGGRRSFFADFKYVQAGGIRVKTLIQSGVAVAFTDDDLDLYEETATVTVATTVTDKEEVRVFFPGYSGDDAWEIRPVDVVISGGVATITFPKAYIVRPDLQNKVPSPDDPALIVDGDDNTNFVNTVDVYRVYHSESQQVVLYNDPSCGSNVPTEVTGSFYVRDSKRGILAYTQAAWSSTTEEWTPSISCTYMPYRLKSWYRAGLKNIKSSYPNLRMEETLERLIIYYALTLADKNICGCNNFQDHINYLNTDLARVGDKVYYQLPPRVQNNPLGTKVAAINLWRYILQIQVGSSVRR